MDHIASGTTALAEIFTRNRGGERTGIYSVCSAHPMVIAAAIDLAHQRRQIAVIEATCNQVNQFGGYTGMQPADFARRVHDAAERQGFSLSNLVLGGDHLGPQPWRKERAETAMAKALDLVEAFVRAGFTKIHLDCSMRCLDDPEILPEATTADRAALMAERAEAVAAEIGASLVYVVGTEVPPPGGMGQGHELVVTPPERVADTWTTHQRAFEARGLAAALRRVAAIVVQPGVDFGNEDVVYFSPAKAEGLAETIVSMPGLVFEAHSTDYQLPAGYTGLVDAHFAILKVGPAATFALREALYALEAIEREMLPAQQRSGLREALETAMLAMPSDWEGHYFGSESERAYLRHFSYSDRLRYYWPEPNVEAATQKLLANLGVRALPLPLLSQYFPQFYEAITDGSLAADAATLVLANIQRALAPYADACGTHSI